MTMQPSALRPPGAAPFRWPVAVLLAASFALGHALANAPLASSVLLQSFNWLFDFDSSRLVAWCQPGTLANEEFGLSFAGRHPLSVAMRPLCMPLLPFAGSPQSALMLLTATVAGASVAIAYLLAAASTPRETDRVMLALCFGLWIQPLVQGMVPETYGWAMAGIGLHFWLISRCKGSGLALEAPRWAVASLFLNFGITVTNAGLDLLSAVVKAWGRLPLARWWRANGRVALVALGLVLVVSGAGAYWVAPDLFVRGDHLAKEMWWTINIKRGVEPASGLQVLWTFVVTNVVAPAITHFDLAPGEFHWMADYREIRMGWAGWLATVLWLALLAVCSAAALKSTEQRRNAVIALVWLSANVALHTYWQYRGSVFLYGPHAVFALYALLAWGCGELLPGRGGWAVRAALVALIVLLALNNFPAYQALIDFTLAPPPHPTP